MDKRCTHKYPATQYNLSNCFYLWVSFHHHGYCDRSRINRLLHHVVQNVGVSFKTVACFLCMNGVQCCTIYALICHAQIIHHWPQKGCDSVLTDETIQRYLFISMTSNESSFVCLAEVVVMSHLLQCELLCRCYSSLPCVPLHNASFQFHSFSV